MEFLTGTLIVVVGILGLVCILLYASNCNYEVENKGLRIMLDKAKSNNKQYLSLSTHQQIQERSLKIWELEGKIQGRDKHIAELNCKLNVQYRITSTLMEELADERIKNNQLSNIVNKDASNVCKKSVLDDNKPVVEPLLKKYQNRRDVIYAIQFSLNNIDRIVEELSNIGVNIAICDYANKTITIHNAYEHMLVAHTVKEFEYIVKVNKELKVMNAKEFRSLYELEQC